MSTESEIGVPVDPVKIMRLGTAALVLVVVTAALPVFFPQKQFAFVANGVLMVYVYFAFRLGRGNAQVASRLAENVYFLGYLLTITGLGFLAWEIGNHPEMLDKEKINGVLLKGGSAIISTIIGLFGMNLIKGYAQSLEHKQEQEADVVERILTQFAKRLEDSQRNQGQELIKIFEASQLSQNMQALSTQLLEGTRSIETLKETSTAANETLADLASKMEAINGSVTDFAEVTATIAPTWQHITANIQTAASLTTEITAMTDGIKQLRDTLIGGDRAMQQYFEDARQYQQVMAGAMAAFQQCLQALTPLTNAVDKLVQKADGVASTLQALGQDFRELDTSSQSLGQNLGNLVPITGQLNTELATGRDSMGHLNTALTAGEARILDVNKKCGEMGRAIDDLVAELKHQVHSLTTLSEPFTEFALLSNQITPILNKTGANIAHLNDFAASLANLKSGVEELDQTIADAKAEVHGAVKDAKAEMEGISKVLENFVRMMETTLRAKSGR